MFSWITGFCKRGILALLLEGRGSNKRLRWFLKKYLNIRAYFFVFFSNNIQIFIHFFS